MKAVILCGGKGTRLGEHGRSVPKALIRIGGKPIIWHILSIYSHFGITEFVLCLGYLGDEIKAYFNNLDHAWKIAFADTGQETNTGGRLSLVEPLLEGQKDFCVTYGDGLSDISIKDLIDFHRDHGRAATVTAVHPHSNFGLMDVDEHGSIVRFREKPILQEWINGGFFVFDQRIFRVLADDSILEKQPFEALSSQGQMMAYKHEGFWKCMDTFKDNLEFEELWTNGAPWRVW